jgi:predicted amidohydrolase YtcJ
VGKRADLAVLDRNVFEVGAGLPGDARVTHTVAGGVVVHEPA